jgi:DNA-binding NarL/FixJ family response regulator
MDVLRGCQLEIGMPLNCHCMNSEKISIVIVDDHQIMRETWRLILEQDARFFIVAECTSGAEAIRAANDLHFDIMLMDINMPELTEAQEKF